MLIFQYLYLLIFICNQLSMSLIKCIIFYSRSRLPNYSNGIICMIIFTCIRQHMLYVIPLEKGVQNKWYMKCIIHIRWPNVKYNQFVFKVSIPASTMSLDKYHISNYLVTILMLMQIDECIAAKRYLISIRYKSNNQKTRILLQQLYDYMISNLTNIMNKEFMCIFHTL